MHTKTGNSIILILVVVAVLAGLGILYYGGASKQEDALNAPLPPVEKMGDAAPEDTIIEIGAEDEMSSKGTVMEARPLKEFTLTGKSFEFSTKEIRVQKGDFVRIHFSSADGLHDWTLGEFSARTQQVNTGNSSSVDFTADKTGTFEFYCSVGNHRQMGMVGKLIVEE